MLLLFLPVLLSCRGGLTEATWARLPRMTFTENETTVKRLPLLGHKAPVAIVLTGEPDIVIAAGQKRLTSFNFQNHNQTSEDISTLWPECTDDGPQQRVKVSCSYNITVVHKRETANLVFLCGSNGMQTVCCDMNVSEKPLRCVPSEDIGDIKVSIREFAVQEGEPSVLVESKDSDLYITHSGSQDYVGIHKFGKNRVAPAKHNKEQHYVGLVLSRRTEPMQNKVYAFYKEKNLGQGLNSEMWLPFVTQVCTNDRGGPKNNLQFSWTSHMNARLFCGDTDSRQYFTELIDVATVHADRWQDTTVYALFRNEWGMSAVCVYTIQDIEYIFTTSPFKGTHNPSGRSRKCVEDSTKISSEVLRMIMKHSEMEWWVRPVNKAPPLLIHHLNYTHIYVDRSHSNRDNHLTVLFLSLNNGGIHKVMQNESQTFVIAEYRPFNQRTHILSITLHPSSRKLFVRSRNELVQVDVENCAHYGDSCVDCVLSRDPHCGWDGTQCTPVTRSIMPDVTKGNHGICVSPSTVQLPGKSLRYSTDKAKGSITLQPSTKYFLRCRVSSNHAQYSWHHREKEIPCSSREQQCLLLIDSMGPEQEGIYTCMSEEMGFSRVMVQYQLQLRSRAAGRSWSPLIWFCLMAVLMKSLSK